MAHVALMAPLALVAGRDLIFSVAGMARPTIGVSGIKVGGLNFSCYNNETENVHNAKFWKIPVLLFLLLIKQVV